MNNLQGENPKDITFLDYLRVIWKWKILIIAVVFLTVLTTTIKTSGKKAVYEATAVITPVSEEKGSGGLAVLSQQFGGFPGLSLPPSTSTAEIMNLLKSKMIRGKMIERYNLMPILFPEDWEEGKQEWKAARSKWDGLRELDSRINIQNNVKDNTILVSAQFHNPEITVKLINYLLTTMTEYMGNEARRAALTKRRFLEEQLRTTSDPMIRQKINNLISQQIETAMMSEISEDFAFKIIDPPLVPDKGLKSNRIKTITLSILTSFFAGIFLSFFFEYIIRKIKTGQ